MSTAIKQDNNKQHSSGMQKVDPEFAGCGESLEAEADVVLYGILTDCGTEGYVARKIIIPYFIKKG